MSNLSVAYNDYTDNGGQIAQEGFAFQSLSGIFHMFSLHKEGKEFKITFEVQDDIMIHNIDDGKKYKIQVKAQNLTKGAILKEDKNGRSILGKLLLKDDGDEYDEYIISFPLDSSDNLKKAGTSELEPLIGGTDYVYNRNHKGSQKEEEKHTQINDYLDDERLVFKEIPFSKSVDNGYRYLYSFANESLNGIITHEQLKALLGTITLKTSSKNEMKRELNNDIIKELEKNKKEEELFIKLLSSVEIGKSFIYSEKIKINKGIYDERDAYYNSYLSKVKLAGYDDDENFLEYYDGCHRILTESLSKDERIILNKYIVGIFIINKVVKEGGHYGI